MYVEIAYFLALNGGRISREQPRLQCVLAPVVSDLSLEVVSARSWDNGVGHVRLCGHEHLVVGIPPCGKAEGFHSVAAANMVET